MCVGDLADINITVNLTSPPTVLKVVVGYTIFGNFVPITSTNNTTVTNINVPNLGAQNYTIRLVDSISYYPPPNGTGPPGQAGQDPNSIYDVSSINITQPLQLTNTAVQNTALLCFGDCDASATVNILGGTPPYSISFDGERILLCQYSHLILLMIKM